MAVRKTEDQLAHAQAEGLLSSLLIRRGVAPDTAAQEAHEFMRELTLAGWRHVRPRPDPVPPRAEPGDPEYRKKAADWARDQIHQRQQGRSS